LKQYWTILTIALLGKRKKLDKFPLLKKRKNRLTSIGQIFSLIEIEQRVAEHVGLTTALQNVGLVVESDLEGGSEIVKTSHNRYQQQATTAINSNEEDRKK
jgi:hypothetical protein